MRRKSTLKTLTGVKQLIIVFLLFCQCLNAQTSFDAGDKVEIFFANATNVVIGDDTDTDATNDLSLLDTSDEDTPLIGAGDYVVFRNSGTENGIVFDAVVQVSSVIDYTGSIDSSDGQIADNNAAADYYIMTNVSSSCLLYTSPSPRDA